LDFMLGDRRWGQCSALPGAAEPVRQAQGPEPFGSAQGPEPVERPVEGGPSALLKSKPYGTLVLHVHLN
jgi:hypothetical protein